MSGLHAGEVARRRPRASSRSRPRSSRGSCRSRSRTQRGEPAARRVQEVEARRPRRRADRQQPRGRSGRHARGAVRAPAADRQRHGRHGRRPRPRPDHADRRPDPPARHARRRSPVRSPASASTTTRSGARSGTPAPPSRGPPPWRTASRRCRCTRSRASGSLDFGQYLAGPFGPMIIGDLGADVIKVEPVTGDGMRMAAHAVLRLPARQARHRPQHQDARGPRDRDGARREGRHRPPQHDEGHRRAGSASTTTACRAVKPDIIYCNTYAYGLEGPLSHFGGLDPLYQASAGLEHEVGRGAPRPRPALLPLRHVRRRQRDAVGGRRARRAVPPAHRPARARSCGRA